MEQLYFYIAVALICAAILPFLFKGTKKHYTKKKVKRLAARTAEMTTKEFFNYRKEVEPFEGVYILYNMTQNKYYVGQSKNVLQRVNNHLTGHGNGDVYADYKYGNRFTVKLIPLKNSGFQTLNELEKSTIMTYDAFAKGYNKTRGNKG